MPFPSLLHHSQLLQLLSYSCWRFIPLYRLRASARDRDEGQQDGEELEDEWDGRAAFIVCSCVCAGQRTAREMAHRECRPTDGRCLVLRCPVDSRAVLLYVSDYVSSD